jgi:hypothetical protein
MRFFVAGLQVKVEPDLDLNWLNMLAGTVIEAAMFWLLGFVVGALYNRLSAGRS